MNGEEHVKDIAFLTTLAGYIHWRLTGEKVMGIGEASGMFPIDSEKLDYDENMIRKFRALTGIELRNILSKVLVAGEYGGTLAAVGAADGTLRDRGAVMHKQDQRTFPDMHCLREQGTSLCFGKR